MEIKWRDGKDGLEEEGEEKWGKTAGKNYGYEVNKMAERIEVTMV